MNTSSSPALSPLLSQSFWETVDELPYEFYSRVHALGGIAWDEQMKSWIVTGYELVQKVLRDDVAFSHPYLSMQAGAEYMKIRSDNPRSSQFLTGEKHRAFHRWWLIDLLSPNAVRQYKAEIVDPWIGRLFDELDGRTQFDMVADFAERVPMGIFAALLGLPSLERSYLDRIKYLNDAIASFASVANALKLETERSDETQRVVDEAVAAAEELNALLLPLVRERRDGDGTDFISRLWKGGPAIFEDWNERDTLDACRRLLFAGVDTTTHAISNAYYMMLSDRTLFDRLRADPAKWIAPFAEEVLRLNGSVQFRPRRANVDAELGKVKVRKGDMLTVALIGANRDASRYQCPHAVDLERKRPQDHFAFNYGPRTCLGAHLARAELVCSVSQGLARLPTMRLDATRAPPRFAGFLMRSYRPIHVVVGDGAWSSDMSRSTPSATRNPSAAAGKPQ
jgi:cytochrome P450